MTGLTVQALEKRIKDLEARMDKVAGNNYVLDSRVHTLELKDDRELKREVGYLRQDVAGVKGLLDLLVKKLKFRLVYHTERKEYVKEHWWSI